MKRLKTTATFLGLLLGLAGAASAGTEGRLQGTVKDPDGKPLAGVQVTVNAVEVQLEQSRKTNKKGGFTLLLVDATRTFNIRLEAEGYRTIEEELALKIGGVVRRSWTMVPATASSEAAEGAPPTAIEGTNKMVKLYNSGLDAFNAGDLETAIGNFEQVAELDPTLAEAYSGLAMAYLRQKDNAKAAAAAERLLELRENDVNGLRVLYEANRALGNSAEEAAALARLEELDKTPSTARRVFNAGVADYQAGDYDGAAARFRQALEMDPALTPAHVALARIYVHQGDLEQGRASAERVVELDPKNGEILGLLYVIHRADGDEGKAEETFAALQAADPDYVGRGFFDQGVSYFNAGDSASATRIFEGVIATLPDHPKAHYMLGLSLLSSGKTVRAKSLLQRFLELAPDDPDAGTARQMLDSM